MAEQNIEIEAKCHSGYIYADEPWSFIWKEKELRIGSVERAWQEPGRNQAGEYSESLPRMANYLNCVTMNRLTGGLLLNLYFEEKS